MSVERDRQRLYWALLAAFFLHAAVLSVHFAASQPVPPPLHTLTVSLTPQQGGTPAVAPPPGPVPVTPSRPSVAPPAPPADPGTTLIATLAPSETAAPQRQTETVPTPPPTPVTPPRPRASPRDSLSLLRPPTTPEPKLSYSEQPHDSEAADTLANVYEQAWHRHMEKIATLNFPEEALQRGLTGSLKLEVALNADGTVHSIKIVQSSGQPLLDQAAQDIVWASAPYAPFPEELRRQRDIIRIYREWTYLQGDTE